MELINTPFFYDASLIAYYRLENVNDSTLNGYNLTNNNVVTFTAAEFGNGANLGASNTNKYLGIGSNLGINGNDNMTIMGWVQNLAEITTGVYRLFSHGSTGGLDRFLNIYYDYNGGARRVVANFSGSNINYTLTMGTSSFYHLAAVRDVGNNLGSFYVNGVLIGTIALGSTTVGLNNFNIGATIPTGPDYSSSLFDDTGIFKRVFSLNEINQIYIGSFPGGGIL